MILRLSAAAAAAGSAGVVMGLTGVLAACTLTRAAMKLAEMRAGQSVPPMPDLPQNPFAADPVAPPGAG